MVNLEIHLEGYIKTESDDSELFLSPNPDINYGERIANIIQRKLSRCSYERSKNQKYLEDGFTEGTDVSIYIPNVALRMYFSDKKEPLETIQKNVILQTFGGLDVYQKWYGYSEYTIEGFDLINLTIGNHDLESILRTYLNKYVYIIIEFEA
ncbi:hypothetical protein NST17_19960 [Caldifermentibacillus hisashii]|uniref:Uncharacterized protein n=1 Tax=Caldifermentibacillus hisashii TaxID=996558 RepID=A0ABU9K552_9BACI